ncbi:centrosomal protein of 63 kDa-like isoform X7 [Ruditapes philippinarum]|uniref:centrosomal protein of 63 kDa-like isoform X7 n=1 Tax=Ruditapes philippinarum TaxID=129788 RepID=UPI00295B60FE|nr:centrosomal protein of 63 kDa-like isoform X7 [Ruditapes philippinarum]
MEWMESVECREIYKRILPVLSKIGADGRVKTMDLPITGMWSELQRENRFPKGALTVNCEKELQELMKQIDKLVAGKKKEWEREKEGLQSRLGIREKECQMSKSTLEQKHQEIGQLRQQLEGSENKQRELVSQYESQLSVLKTEVQNLQREYERLHKRHTKQKKESEKDKEKSMVEIQDGMKEVHRLVKKVEDYRQRSRDWEIDRRALQKQVESLEAQRKAIADKCEFVQNSKVDKLKASLDEAMTSHKKAMDDNERLLNDLKKANNQVRKLEELNSEFQAELRARDDFLRMSEEDSKQHAKDIALLNKQISEKDDIIRSLSDTKARTEDEQISMLRKNLTDTEDQARLSKRNEELLSQENHQLSEELTMKRDDCDGLNRKLDQKEILSYEASTRQYTRCIPIYVEIGNMKSDILRLEDELSQVKSQLTQAQAKLSSLSASHEAEVNGMKDQLARVTEELHGNSNNFLGLKEKSGNLERKLKTEEEEVKKRDAELKVANAQIDALRLENRHLRQTIIQQTQVNLDHTETETQLREIQDQYHSKMKALEKENRSLKDEVSILQQDVSTMEDQYDQQLQRTVHETELSHAEEMTREQRRIHEIEEDSDRRVSMLQDRLDSTINRYEEQLQLLRRQKTRLEDDLENERRAGSSFRRDNIVIEEDDDGVMYINEDMSLADSENELMYEMPAIGESASEKFLVQEQERTRQLESIIDSHIESLKSNSETAIKKHKR